MVEYEIYKGAGKTVEFKGLKSQYLIGFFVGVFSLFLLYVVLSVAEVPSAIRIFVVLSLTSVMVYYVFKYNKKYGQFGLMKQNTRRRCPRFILRRKSFFRMQNKE
jgi:hypothetical protein